MTSKLNMIFCSNRFHAKASVLSVCFAWGFWLVPNFLFAQQISWKAVSTDVVFSLRNAGSEVQGRFEAIEGNFISDTKTGLPVLIAGQAKVGSISTGIGLRDRHLMARSYFHESKFPEIGMQLIAVKENELVFNLKMRGVEKQFRMPYSWEAQGDRASFEVEFSLNRRDFGVGGASLTMGDEVRVKLRLELKKE